jgi:hypothetical protein
MAKTAQNMISILEDFLASNAGVRQITVDGQTIQLDRAQAIEELKYWQREAAKASGKRKPFRSINIGSAF